MERVERERFGALEIIGDAASVFEVLVEIVRIAGYRQVLPELVAQPRDCRKRFFEAVRVPRHADIVPEELSETAVELSRRFVSLDGEQLVDARLDARFGFPERVVIRAHHGELGATEV